MEEDHAEDGQTQIFQEFWERRQKRPGGKGGKVKSRKQAIAIGLSKARKKGKKVPKKKS